MFRKLLGALHWALVAALAAAALGVAGLWVANRSTSPIPLYESRYTPSRGFPQEPAYSVSPQRFQEMFWYQTVYLYPRPPRRAAAVMIDQGALAVAYSRLVNDRASRQLVRSATIRTGFLPAGLLRFGREFRTWRKTLGPAGITLQQVHDVYVLSYLDADSSELDSLREYIVATHRDVGAAPPHPIFVYQSSKLFVSLLIPLMVLSVYPCIFVTVRLASWRRRRARRKAGSCLRCGYDLTGNVSGLCPECGTAVG
jgi:hypothetical protein